MLRGVIFTKVVIISSSIISSNLLARGKVLARVATAVAWSVLLAGCSFEEAKGVKKISTADMMSKSKAAANLESANIMGKFSYKNILDLKTGQVIKQYPLIGLKTSEIKGMDWILLKKPTTAAISAKK